jgi:Protein of unknown function (DUF3892)
MSKHIIQTKRSGDTHQSITDYNFRDDTALTSEWKTKANGVSYVQANPGSTKVSGSGSEAVVYVHGNANGPDYLQTKADGNWTDNLLALPVVK